MPVGLTFRKSFSLPGGFRINLSKSGVGASWGVKGLRIGTGPRGSRLNAYIPGTGLGWTTSLGGGRGEASKRAEGGGGKKVDRPPAPAPSDDRPRAAQAVAEHEARLAWLVSAHKEASRPWDWAAIGAAPAPVPPTSVTRHEQAAQQALAAYQPSTAERVLGTEARAREALAAALEEARRRDRAENQAAFAQHDAELARWTWWHRLAQGLHDGDLDAYDAVFEHLSPFRELGALGSSFEATALSAWAGQVRFRANGREIIPAEALSLTRTGKLSSRKLGATRAAELYQDHVCSAVLRIAREALAVLPFELVLVHARTAALDTATGHDTEQTVVSAAFTREEMDKIDFSRIDPSDALERFPHAMSFSTRTGFAPVDEIGAEDLPVDHGG